VPIGQEPKNVPLIFAAVLPSGNLILEEFTDARFSLDWQNVYARSIDMSIDLTKIPKPNNSSENANANANANAVAGQGLIALAAIETPEGVIRLASPSNDEEFARILYSALREADAQGLTEVVAMQPIGIGIAVAIRDRLARAANGR
jgi:hypothetical protein